MKGRTLAAGSGCVAVVMAAVAWGQAPGTPKPSPAGAQSAVVETSAISLIPAEHFALTIVLEPYRRVSFRATSDGIVRSLAVAVGASVREGQEVFQMDRAEAAARQKIADAEVAEARTVLEATPATELRARAIAQAKLDVARAHVELAQIDMDRCIVRAPFSGRVMTIDVAPGQYLAKGENLGDLADDTIVKALVPIETPVKPGETLNLAIEGKPATGKVQTVLPLPESLAVLRELDLPWAAAWVHLDNPQATFEPGQRVRGPATIAEPVALIPARGLHGTTVQVVRNGRVVDLVVKPCGDAGFDRCRVAGPFLATDSVVVQTSIPLVAGTVIRFQGDPPLSGAANAIPFGSAVDLSSPPPNPTKPATPAKISPTKPKMPTKSASGGVPF